MDAKENVHKVRSKSKGFLGKLGPILFLVGVVVAILVGLLIGADMIETNALQADDTWGYIAAVLTGLGFLVGLVTILGTGSITKDEIALFLTGSIALVVVGIAGQNTLDIPFIGSYVSGVTLCMILFFGPAAVVIALKTLWDLGKD